MSFTSQNYGLRKLKRMDKILMDCLILTVVVSLVLGGGVYLFGAEILRLYTEEAEVNPLWYRNFCIYHRDIFPVRNYGSFPGALRGMDRSTVPMILSVIGTVGTRIVWVFWLFPAHRSLAFLFISYPASWLITIAMQVICFILRGEKCMGNSRLC